MVAMPAAAALFALIALPVAILTGEPRYWAMAVLGPAIFAYAGYRIWRSRNPRVAAHLTIAPEPGDVARGGEVAVRVEVADPDAAGEHLEVGVVCTVWYDRWERTTRSTADGGSSRSRVTHEEVAHEQWRPASPSQRVQSVSFAIPPNAPFSHEGSCLSFAWRAAAREPGTLGTRIVRDAPFWVTP